MSHERASVPEIADHVVPERHVARHDGANDQVVERSSRIRTSSPRSRGRPPRPRRSSPGPAGARRRRPSFEIVKCEKRYPAKSPRRRSSSSDRLAPAPPAEAHATSPECRRRRRRRWSGRSSWLRTCCRRTTVGRAQAPTAAIRMRDRARKARSLRAERESSGSFFAQETSGSSRRDVCAKLAEGARGQWGRHPAMQKVKATVSFV